VREHLGGLAAQQQARDAAPPVRGHHDEIAALAARGLQDALPGLLRERRRRRASDPAAPRLGRRFARRLVGSGPRVGGGTPQPGDVTVRSGVELGRRVRDPADALPDGRRLQHLEIGADGEQVLVNLLDNAVKYGPAGQEVRIGASRENGAARLWVEDGGPGIPRADRERVWVRFWRLERDRDSAVAGSGIGLAVVRELASLHHGRAFIDDTAPTGAGGTRVVIELPA